MRADHYTWKILRGSPPDSRALIFCFVLGVFFLVSDPFSYLEVIALFSSFFWAGGLFLQYFCRVIMKIRQSSVFCWWCVLCDLHRWLVWWPLFGYRSGTSKYLFISKYLKCPQQYINRTKKLCCQNWWDECQI